MPRLLVGPTRFFLGPKQSPRPVRVAHRSLDPTALRCFGVAGGLAVVVLLNLFVRSPVSAQEETPNSSAANDTFSAEQIEFFEKRIRPVLVERCEECHSQHSDPIQGGLLVDSREGLLTGGDSGPAVVASKPNESLLLEAIRYESYEMPPDEMLSDEQIADFERWIAMGAPDPRSAPNAKPVRTAIDFDKARQHWAYQPVSDPAIPKIGSDWSSHPIDRFLFRQMHAQGLTPTNLANRKTLVRRLYYDLIGLPPSPEQVQQFVQDNRPDAYERLVDELLASPRFGEHWGRHWLDVARFAESLTLRGFVLPEAWRYRDYVIDSFNRDRPYDEFLQQQLAGDLLPAETIRHERENLIATTFLVLGNTNLEQQDKQQLEMDFVDEQLDVIGKGLMAQTLTCARCHDHKFDPIPTRDYYAIAGIFSNVVALEHENVSKWIEQPLPLDDHQQAQFDTWKLQIAKLEQERQALEDERKKLQQAQKLNGIVIDQRDGEMHGEWVASTYTKPFLGQDYAHDDNQGKGAKEFRFSVSLPKSGRYEVRLAYTSGTNRATNVPITIVSVDGETQVTVNERKAPPILNQFAKLGEFAFSEKVPAEVVISNAETDGHVIVDGLQFVSIDDKDSPQRPELVQRQQRIASIENELKQHQQDIAKLQQKLEQRPRVMTLREKAEVAAIPIHIRGNVHSLGEVVPRGMLQVIDIDQTPTIPDNASGRLEFAQWLTASDHPLTSRVYANRIWYWLWGQGIVSTVDNFGTTGAEPSHPELLDYLAQQLKSNGGSTKALVREIVLSKAYQLDSTASTLSRQLDPENVWLSHAPRKRLPAEAIRDTMIMAAGKLDVSVGGRTYPARLSKDYDFHYDGMRRSVYLPVFRNSLPELFEVFDFPNPSLVTGKRTVSTTATQALWMLNHPFVLEQANATAKRLLAEVPVDDQARIERAYRLCLGRLPTQTERQLALDYVQTEEEQQQEREAVWSRLVQTLFATVDFQYIR